MIHRRLTIGQLYSKVELSEVLEKPKLSKVREGVYNFSNKETMFFVTLEKDGMEERFHFDDFFEGDYFHWDSQTVQSITSPKIQEIVNGVRIPHLFVRVRKKVRSRTQRFVYCGRLKFIESEDGTSYPVHMIYQNIDYIDDTLDERLLEVYNWTPQKIGKTTKSKISKKNIISEERRKNYKKPNKTERTGLVTSRVGQGYYRREVRDKWNNRCPVTNCQVLSVLISSHIVPWSESNDDERLDVENGILLSPNVDSLFDRHLISFSDEGDLLFRDEMIEELQKLGINTQIKIPISNGMKPYLRRHREKFNGLN